MPYLNSAVFYQFLPEGPWQLTDMPPRAMAGAVERGDLQAGPLPVAEVFRLGNTLRPLGDIGVAATGPATSVLLLSQPPGGGHRRRQGRAHDRVRHVRSTGPNTVPRLVAN